MLEADVFEFVRSEQGYLLREDTLKWTDWYSDRGVFREKWPTKDRADLEANLWHLFQLFPEFRSLYDFRTRGTKYYRRQSDLRRCTDLAISATSIGPRFFIQHGHGTYVLAREIGSDFLVNQHVTIGAGPGGIPKIGNKVQIRVGAVVVGGIEIGDDCMIAANATVTTSMAKGYRAYPAQTVFKPPRQRHVGGDAGR
jgi:serine acetyltransferase